MLGMMNCPTSDNLDFYAASPAVRRQLHGSIGDLSAGKGAATDELTAASSSDLAAAAEQKITINGHPVLQKRSSSNALEVFSVAKPKPKISYMEDGRRLVDGKLASGHSTPEKLWNRLIVDSVTTKKLVRDGSQGSNESEEGNDEAANLDGEQIVEEAKGVGKSKRRFSIGSLFPMLKSSSSGGSSRKCSQFQKKANVAEKQQQAKKHSAISTSSSTKSAGAESL